MRTLSPTRRLADDCVRDGGYPVGSGNGDGKLRDRGEFLGRLGLFWGAAVGRAVTPAWEGNPSREVGKSRARESSSQESGPARVSPDPRVMPAGSEIMYLAAEAPWLKTDADWTALYANPVGANQNDDLSAHDYLAIRRVKSNWSPRAKNRSCSMKY